MLFQRYERYEPITLTDRKAKAFLRKQQKERDRYPLFSEHVAAEQHTLDDELQRRERSRVSFEETMRQSHARSWRQARKLYFSLSDEIRATIRTEWEKWPGPRTSGYFWSMVDLHSGQQAKRLALAKIETDRIAAEVRKKFEAGALQLQL